MELTLQQLEKKSDMKIQVSDIIFESPYNEPLIHQALTAFMAGARSGTKAQKTRADVSGSGKKPWRQKGTGRARVGSIRNPLWRGGGVTFAAKPKSYKQKLNKKMYCGAMRSILAELNRQDRLILVDDLVVKQPKTKDVIIQLKSLGLVNVLLVTESLKENLSLSIRNIPNIDTVVANKINPRILLTYEHVLMTKTALEEVEGLLQ